MAADLDPVRPVHPGWPPRPVSEEGDERRRYPPAKPRRDDIREEGPDGDDEPGGSDEGSPRSPDDPTGRHVDEYA